MIQSNIQNNETNSVETKTSVTKIESNETENYNTKGEESKNDTKTGNEELRMEKQKKEEKKVEDKKQETKIKETKIKETKTKETKNKETKNKEAKNKETKAEETKAKEVKAKDVKTTVVEEAKIDKSEQDSGEKGRKIKFIISGIIFSILVVVLGIYIGGVIYYKQRFFPRTFINDISCDKKDIKQIETLLQKQLIDDYKISVFGRDLNSAESDIEVGVISGTDIGLRYEDVSTAISDLLQLQNQWIWPYSLFHNEDRKIALMGKVTFDKDKMQGIVEAWDICQEDNMIVPQNAYVGDYNETKKQYVIVPETKGTVLNINQMIDVLADKITARENSVNIEEYDCYQEATVKHTDKELTDSIAEVNQWLKTEIKYDWNGNEVILDAETLAGWILKENGEFILDKQAVEAYVKEQANKFDTYGKRKEFITVSGEKTTLKSPNYGWKTDIQLETEELVQLITKGSIVKREPLYSIKAKQKGINDIGDSYIEADLTNQHMYVIENGEIVFETDFVSGTLNSTPDCITPEGIFGLTYKTTDAILRGANYASHVNYWMPFYGNYGMHDATWRVNFGGTIYQQHGSHGCINLPLESAKTVYKYVEKGSPVICYYYQHDPYAQTQEVTNQYTDQQLEQEHEPTL